MHIETTQRAHALITTGIRTVLRIKRTQHAHEMHIEATQRAHALLTIGIRTVLRIKHTENAHEMHIEATWYAHTLITSKIRTALRVMSAYPSVHIKCNHLRIALTSNGLPSILEAPPFGARSAVGPELA